MARPRLSLRLGVGGLAVALVAGTAAALLVLGPASAPLRALGAGAAGTAVVGLACSLGLGRAEGVALPGAIAIVALDYALVLLGAPRLAAGATAAAPLVAGALFLAAELGWWAVELRRQARESPAALLRRMAWIGTAAVAAAALAAACLLAGGAAVAGGAAPTAVGVAAASLLLALAAWLAARSARQT
ncbi:MAG TPA: hypothetical protein VNN74_02325 [Candidatus Micrarchaeia archaeon]|nr:hypothetical protein [Candidatus Micrarchaeia archaeon]